MIDEATLWLEIRYMPDMMSLTAAKVFDHEWLCRYPWPKKVIFDNSKEFLGYEFQELLGSYNIKPQPTSIKNPQVNGIMEWIHLTMGDMILMEHPFSLNNWEWDINTLLQGIAWAL